MVIGMKIKNCNKSAVLILCHSPIPYVAKLASYERDVNFYIHVDSKIDIEKIKQDFSTETNNVYWIENRINIQWGGFSIIQAILTLISMALENNENKYFHLISGNCVFLVDIPIIAERMSTYPREAIFLELASSVRRRYRIRFNVPHADTKYQRALLGRFLTKFYQLMDKLISPNTEIIKKAPFGNMWFSANIEGMKKLLAIVTEETKNYFRHKLVPDEHFFQYLIIKNNLENYIYNNKRYIYFIGSANHPENLYLEDLIDIDSSEYWIARKVNKDVALNYLKKIKERKYNVEN